VGPVEEALRTRLTRRVNVTSLSGRGTFRFLRTDRLGVVIQVGPSKRVVAIPWPALEGTLGLLQSGGWVRIGSWPQLTPREPATLADYMSGWTGYRQSPSWAAALFAAADLADRPKAIRIRTSAFQELQTWNDRLGRLDAAQLNALGMEIKTAAFYISEGLRALSSLTADNDFYPASFQLLGFGLEHLLKVTLVLGRLHAHDELPSWQEVQSFGHDLIRLRDAVIKMVKESPIGGGLQGQALAVLLMGGPITEMFLSMAGEFTGRTRYFYLDAMLGEVRGSDPSAEYRRLDQALAELTIDPENPSSVPDIFWTAEFGGPQAYYRERAGLLLNDIVSFVSDLASACYYFSPKKDPGYLSFLIYVRYAEEAPQISKSWRLPKRPRLWVDAAVENERWRQKLTEGL
jgi:hypothetical protein